MDNAASTDFRDVNAVFAFQAGADAEVAADCQEEIQTEDRWWSVCDKHPFHEMSTFGRREYLSVVKLPPKCDVFACFK